ncbi:MAG: acyl-CoA dehydrogenase family protein [Planctomycetota bacterium]
MRFTDEHDMIRATVARFVDQELNPHVEAWEAQGGFPAHEVMKKLGDLGLLGLTKPEAFGGAGLDYSFAVVMAEELGRCTAGGPPLAVGVHTDMCTPALARFGSDALREEFLRPAIAGDTVGCVGVSEVQAGSDVAAIETVARKDGDDYVIHGGKMWITNGTQADWMCTLVNTGDGPVHQNKSLVIVPLDLPGVERAKKLDKLGMRSSDTAQIFLENVRVPQRYRIGEEGQGFVMQMLQFQEERLWGSASVLKGMEAILEETIDYTRQRRAFGRSILDNQVVHFRLAELMTEIEALRALVYRATELYVHDEDVTLMASMAKLKAGRLAREVADACLQYFGGMGYMMESNVCRAFRDMRLMSIGGGADEVMLGIICKLRGILPKRASL